MEKEKKTPSTNDIIDLDTDLEQNSCSANDCTGLIPAALQSNAQADSYEKLYPYIVPTIKNNDNAK